MTSTAEQMRDWSGPAVLSYGFRPFFLGAGLWAAVAMALWMPMLNGAATLPTAFNPVSWHAHEFLFGYLGAVVAGFLLTAVPNWTGRLPIVGWPLCGLVALWAVGRLAVAFSADLPVILVGLSDLSFLVVLAAVMAREIIRGRNWRNLIMLALLGALILGNALFHWEAARGAYAAQGMGLRLALGAGIGMVAVVGGRIVPSFTRNWLVKQGSPARPVPPMQPFDTLALMILGLAIAVWALAPVSTMTGLCLLLAGALHGWRLARWRGTRAAAEPLVLVLHAGYAFVPLGAVALGVAILWPEALDRAAAQHVWTAGALGLMTLAVMTRATLAHTGCALTADAATVAIYVMLVASVLARVLASFTPALAPLLYVFSGVAWIAAFGGFSALYGRLLLRPRRME